MKITVCDKCGHHITEVEKDHKIALKVTLTSGLFGLPTPSAEQITDLCEGCYKIVLGTIKTSYNIGITQLKPNTKIGKQAKSYIEGYKRNPKLIIAQLEDCEYESIGGPLVNNLAFIAVKELIRAMEKSEQ